MTRAVLYGDALLGYLRRDFQIARTFPIRLLTQNFTVIVSLGLYYFLSRLVGKEFPSPDDYYSFVVVGILVLQVVTSTLGLPPQMLRQELLGGTWERLVVSPLGPVGAAVGLTLWPFVQSAVAAVATLVLATLVFGIDVRWTTVPLALPVALLAAAAFVPFGLLFSAAVLRTKQAMMGASWVVTGIMIVGGIYFPVSLLPGGIQWMSEVQPFTPAADLLRHLIIGTPLEHAAVVDVAKLAGFALVALPLAVSILALVVRRTRRSGSIVES